MSIIGNPITIGGGGGGEHIIGSFTIDSASVHSDVTITLSKPCEHFLALVRDARISSADFIPDNPDEGVENRFILWCGNVNFQTVVESPTNASNAYKPSGTANSVRTQPFIDQGPIVDLHYIAEIEGTQVTIRPYDKFFLIGTYFWIAW